MCHYRQHAHDDPLYLAGLQDITAHVDFSALAAAAARGGLDLLGYANQAQFLINCGITDVLAATPAENAARLPAAGSPGAKADEPGRNGRIVQGHRAGPRLRCAARRICARRQERPALMRGRTSMTSRGLKLLVTFAVLMFGAPAPAADDAIARAAYRWEHSPHGAMLERILPPSLTPQQLPEADTAGARLVCRVLRAVPSPAQSRDARCGPLEERRRAHGVADGRSRQYRQMMQDLMADVKCRRDEQATLLRYLQKHAQRELNRGRYPDLNTDSGRRYSIACAQCHVLPDPRRHTARGMAGCRRAHAAQHGMGEPRDRRPAIAPRPNPNSTPPTSRTPSTPRPMARVEWTGESQT